MMKFVIKNYIKGSNREKLYATLTYLIKDISEAKEKIAELIGIIRSTDSKTMGAGKTIKLLTALFDVSKKEENDELIVKIFLPNENDEAEADCMAKISWCLENKEESRIDFEQSLCDISGLHFPDQEGDWNEEELGVKIPFKKAVCNIHKIPLNKFEEYARETPDTRLDKGAGITFSERNY